jgi:hypothetical protein
LGVGAMNKNELEQKRNSAIVMAKEVVYKMSYGLTAQEFRLSRYLINQIQKDDKPDKMYTLHICDYNEELGITDGGNNYEHIRKAMRAIDDKVYEIDKNGKWKRIKWFNALEGDKNTGIIKYSFNYAMVPYLFDLIKNEDGYIQYISGCFYCLKRFASQRLYEMLIDKVHMKNQMLIVSIDGLKKELKGENYTRYRDFRVNILDKAVEDINKLTDIRVSFRTDKPRGMTRLYFDIEYIGEDNNEIARDKVYNKHYDEEQKEFWEKAVARNQSEFHYDINAEFEEKRKEHAKEREKKRIEQYNAFGIFDDEE